MYDFDLDDENLATSPLPASPQLSDSDGSSRRKPRGETEESADDIKIDTSSGAVVINVGAGGEETHIALELEDSTTNNNNSRHGAGTPKNLGEIPISAKTSTEDSKNRKRRKKRKRNQVIYLIIFCHSLKNYLCRYEEYVDFI